MEVGSWVRHLWRFHAIMTILVQVTHGRDRTVEGCISSCTHAGMALENLVEDDGGVLHSRLDLSGAYSRITSDDKDTR